MEYAPSSSSRLSPVWVVGLLALGIVAFGNGIYGKFIFDDGYNIADNEAIRGLPPLSAILTPRGLGTLSFAFNYAAGGLDERGYHLVNIAIHLAAACTLLGIVRRTLLLPDSTVVFREHATFLAFAIAAIWMVHPLQTQSVTYIVQRLEALMGLFFLLTLYCTMRGATAERAGWVWYVGAVAAFGLSLLSKEVAIVAPVVVLLYDRMFLAKSWAEVAKRRWGLYLAFLPGMFWLLAMMSGAFTPLLDADANTADNSVGFGLSFMTPWKYLRSQPAVLLHYLLLSFWPSQLCLDYLWQIESNPWRIYGFGLIIVVLVLGSVVLYLRQRPVGFLGLAFFLILAPTSSFVPIADLAFEHRMYLSLAPLATLVVLGGYLLMAKVLPAPSNQQIFAAVVGVVVIALVARTVLRNRDYHDPVVMWGKVVEQVPHSNVGRYSLALSLMQSNRPDRLGLARKHLEDAIELTPHYTDAHLNLALVLEEQKQPVPAEREFRIALEQAPKKAKVNCGLGRFLANHGRPAEAVPYLERAIELNPKYCSAYDALGNVYARQEEYRKAAEQYRKAVAVDPDYASGRLHLAMTLSKLGEFEESNQLCREQLQADPGDVACQTLLAWNLAVAPSEELRNGQQALQLAQHAVAATNRASLEPLESLAAAFAELDQFEDAALVAQDAIAIAGSQKRTADLHRLEKARELYESRRKMRLPSESR